MFVSTLTLAVQRCCQSVSHFAKWRHSQVLRAGEPLGVDCVECWVTEDKRHSRLLTYVPGQWSLQDWPAWPIGLLLLLLLCEHLRWRQFVNSLSLDFTQLNLLRPHRDRQTDRQSQFSASVFHWVNYARIGHEKHQIVMQSLCRTIMSERMNLFVNRETKQHRNRPDTKEGNASTDRSPISIKQIFWQTLRKKRKRKLLLWVKKS